MKHSPAASGRIRRTSCRADAPAYVDSCRQASERVKTRGNCYSSYPRWSGVTSSAAVAERRSLSPSRPFAFHRRRGVQTAGTLCRPPDSTAAAFHRKENLHLIFRINSVGRAYNGHVIHHSPVEKCRPTSLQTSRVSPRRGLSNARLSRGKPENPGRAPIGKKWREAALGLGLTQDRLRTLATQDC
jgi:hypothetical protein